MKETNGEQIDSCYFDPFEIDIVKKLFGIEKRFNPRGLENPGFTYEKIEELKKGIQKDGLRSPILVRIDERGKPKLIAGERRLRAIQILVELDIKAKERIEAGDTKAERVLTKNPKTGKMEFALEVYKKQGVECKISDATDEREWYRQAIQENTLHEPLTEYDLLVQCHNMEESGLSRAEQAAILDKSGAWISQSHSLLDTEENHPKLLECIQNGTLCRTAALTFIGVPKDKQPAALDAAIAMHYADCDKKLALLTKELKDAEDTIVAKEGQLQLDKYLGCPSANKSEKQVQRAHKKRKNIEEKIKIVESSKDKIPVETVEKAKTQVGADENYQKANSPKQVRIQLTEIREKLETEEEVVEECSKRDIKLVCEVMEWFLDKKKYKDVFELIKSI